MAVSVEIPKEMEEALEQKAEDEFYANKSEVIRAALRNFLKKDEEKTLEEKLVSNLIEKNLVIKEDELSEQERARLEQT